MSASEEVNAKCTFAPSTGPKLDGELTSSVYHGVPSPVYTPYGVARNESEHLPYDVVAADGRPVVSCFTHSDAEKIADRLNSGDQTVDLTGPMFCEAHPLTSWPHGDCAGPGMWVTNAELEYRHILMAGLDNG
jgi:hypothetical protein